MCITVFKYQCCDCAVHERVCACTTQKTNNIISLSRKSLKEKDAKFLNSLVDYLGSKQTVSFCILFHLMAPNVHRRQNCQNSVLLIRKPVNFLASSSLSDCISAKVFKSYQKDEYIP